MSKWVNALWCSGFLLAGVGFAALNVVLLMALCFVVAVVFLVMAAWEIFNLTQFFALPEPEYGVEDVTLPSPPMSTPGVHKLELPRPLDKNR